MNQYPALSRDADGEASQTEYIKLNFNIYVLYLLEELPVNVRRVG